MLNERSNLSPRQWRYAADLTLVEAAAIVGIAGKNPARTWQRWELGERSPPEKVVATVQKLSGGKVTAASWPRQRRDPSVVEAVA